jgi:hypothetical protein
MNRHNPVIEVPLRKRMSEWDWRVTIQQGDELTELYKGQSGLNVHVPYGVHART